MNSPTLTGVLSEVLRSTSNIEHREALKQAIGLVSQHYDVDLSALDLETKYTGSSGWGEHPGFSREDWRDEVAGGDTQSGYWEWVSNKVQS